MNDVAIWVLIAALLVGAPLLAGWAIARITDEEREQLRNAFDRLYEDLGVYRLLGWLSRGRL